MWRRGIDGLANWIAEVMFLSLFFALLFYFMFLTRQTHTHLYSQFGTRIGYSIHKAARPYTRRGSRRVLRPAIARRVHLLFLPVAVCLNSEAGETADARLASHAAAFLQLGTGPQAERGCRYSRSRGRQPHKNTTAKLHSMPALF
jgi:hypothetical protein